MSHTICIGNFDGVHLGHQALLLHSLELSNKNKTQPLVLTFQPHPKLYFQKLDNYKLCSDIDKYGQIHLLGIHDIRVLNFESIVHMTAAEFFEKILKSLSPSILVVGDNFHLGRAREAGVEQIQALCAKHQIELSVYAMNAYQDKAISSSRIRQCLQEGDLVSVQAMLGRPYRIDGFVEFGRQQGRLLGFPTANITTKDFVLPKCAVYASRVYLGPYEAARSAVTSVTQSPMFERKPTCIETHIFDYQGNLYGKSIRVELLEKIRDEAVFDSVDVLVETMHRDVQKAKAILASAAAPRNAFFG